jgi:hypothetical protein
LDPALSGARWQQSAAKGKVGSGTIMDSRVKVAVKNCDLQRLKNLP